MGRGAAKGHFDAHTLVKAGILHGLRGTNPGTLFSRYLPDWYRVLWGTRAQAGILKPVDLAGYRNDHVFISNAQHAPPRREPSALEQASSHKNIAPFADFVAELVAEQTSNHPARSAGS